MKINIEKIQQLLKDEKNNLWEKHNKRRLYLDFANIINLEVSRYNTGNISSAYLEGEKISNSKASKYLSGTAYIDLDTNTLITKFMVAYSIELLQDSLS